MGPRPQMPLVHAGRCTQAECYLMTMSLNIAICTSRVTVGNNVQVTLVMIFNQSQSKCEDENTEKYAEQCIKFVQNIKPTHFQILLHNFMRTMLTPFTEFVSPFSQLFH